MRDHQPAPIEAFNGYFNRGDVENTPVDHFQAANNLRHIGKNVATRDGITISQDVNAVTPLTNIRRIYNYPTITQNTQIVLSYDPNTDTGHIYHVVDSATQFGPVLSIVGMVDFAFVPFGGRAYISPFAPLPPVFPAPATAPTLTGQAGGIIDLGVHNYEVTFFDGTHETTGSAIATITAKSLLANPVIIPNASNLPATLGYLVNGATYKFAFTYTTDSNVTETALGPQASVVSNGGYIVIQPPSLPSITNIRLNIYMTQSNGSSFFRIPAYTNIDPTKFGNFTIGDTINYQDGTIATWVAAPSSNDTEITKVNLTNIPLATNSHGVTITARKVYRTAANGTQLKLLTTINDNTTTTFLDDAADASLGANIPTTNTITLVGDNIDRGLSGEFLYVYAGDGTNARKAAGVGVSGNMTIAAGVGGQTDTGIHVYGVVSVTRSGYQSPPTALGSFNNTGTSVSFGNIPTSGDPNVISRQIVASKAITNFDGNLEGYDLFFIPSAVINNNTDTFINDVSFFDTDLLEDATHLFDNYTSIPAGAFLTLYHGRLVLGCTNDDINLVLVSAAGEPEAISQVDGLLSTQPNGFPVSNAAEFRDVLYVFRPNSAMSFTDNQDVLSSWPLIELDGALGARPHAIGQYLNSQTQSVDYLVIATYQGISLFMGGFQAPELSWKIEEFWKSFDRNLFSFIQVIINTVKKRVYIILPNRSLLVGFFQNGMDPTSIQWEPWTFTQPVNTIAVIGIDEDVIGCDIY